MKDLIIEGGFPMWFVLLFGAGALLSAGLFALRPNRERLPLLLAITTATAFTAIMGIFVDLASVGHHINERWDEVEPILPQVLLQGFAESMAPGILGFGLLSLVALLVVVGFYREARGA